MKTTVELSDALFSELKAMSGEEKKSMRELIETALRLYIDSHREKAPPYRFENHSFKGNGVCEGIEEGKWEDIRGIIYQGRGG